TRQGFRNACARCPRRTFPGQRQRGARRPGGAHRTRRDGSPRSSLRRGAPDGDVSLVRRDFQRPRRAPPLGRAVVVRRGRPHTPAALLRALETLGGGGRRIAPLAPSLPRTHLRPRAHHWLPSAAPPELLVGTSCAPRLT